MKTNIFYVNYEAATAHLGQNFEKMRCCSFHNQHKKYMFQFFLQKLHRQSFKDSVYQLVFILNENFTIHQYVFSIVSENIEIWGHYPFKTHVQGVLCKNLQKICQDQYQAQIFCTLFCNLEYFMRRFSEFPQLCPIFLYRGGQSSETLGI